MLKDILSIIKKVSSKIKQVFSLSNKGERVDINYNQNIKYEDFDIYQKSHIKRYEFAITHLNKADIVGDFACGTGYGTVMLSEKATKAIGVDIDSKVIKAIQKRYENNHNISFIASNILDINYEDYFDKIISFETLEHLEENDILPAFKIYFKALKEKGKIIFSMPYMQKKDENATRMGFHKTFYIDENKINNWLSQAGFSKISFKYQNYKTHEIHDELDEKDFIICNAEK